jgi:hypothetical protein
MPLPPDLAEHLNLAPAPRPGTLPRRSTRQRVLVGDWLEPTSTKARRHAADSPGPKTWLERAVRLFEGKEADTGTRCRPGR